MEGNCRSENLPSSAGIGYGNELNRSNSDASTLTAENCEDVLCRLADVMPDDYTIWTDEKHSLYLELLEASFVKQLHQSMGFFAPCSEQNKRDKNVPEIWQINVNNDTEQVPRVYHSKCLGMHCPTSSAEGTGQNFVDEDIENKSKTTSRAKRLKTSLANSSSHDRITPETFHVAHEECAPKTYESSVPPT